MINDMPRAQGRMLHPRLNYETRKEYSGSPATDQQAGSRFGTNFREGQDFDQRNLRLVGATPAASGPTSDDRA